MKNNEICPHCHRKMVIYRHSLNSILVSALRKIAPYRVAVLSDAGLTHVEINNFSKLKYWNFVKKIPGSKQWEITQFGYDFLSGKEWVYRCVMTYNDKIVGYDGDLVCVNAVTYELMTREDFAKSGITITIPKQPEYTGKLF